MSCGLNSVFRCVILLQHWLEYFIAWIQHLLMDTQMVLFNQQHINLEISKIKLKQATCQILVMDTLSWSEQAETESAAGGTRHTPPVKQQGEKGPIRNTALWTWRLHQTPLFKREKEKDSYWRAREGDKSQDGYEGMLLREETEEWNRRETNCVYSIQMPICHLALQIYGKCSSERSAS